MAVVTYLIGAGASANAIPPVSKFNSRFRDYSNNNLPFYQACKSQVEFFPLSMKKRFAQYFKYFLSEVQKISNELGDNSIDQLAKKFQDNGKTENYQNLKSTLAAIILFEQSHFDFLKLELNNRREFKSPNINYRNIDPRYDFLWSNLLDNNTKKLRENIRFLSWNYDSQLELSYEHRFWEKLQVNINRIPFIIWDELNIYPALDKEFSSRQKSAGFSVTKLNGTAGFIQKVRSKVNYSLELYGKESLDFRIIYSIFENFYESSAIGSDEVRSAIQFAWDNEIKNTDIIETAIERTIDTEVLVVMGYSFPDYNNKVDEQIISKMKNLSLLRVLDKKDEINNRHEKVQRFLNREINFQPSHDLNNFIVSY